ncbi:MAG: hypothetical protein ACOCZ6_01870 [Nanoarchaeota archaeon]
MLRKFVTKHVALFTKFFINGLFFTKPIVWITFVALPAKGYTLPETLCPVTGKCVKPIY